MSMISCNEIRGGTKLLVDGLPWVVIHNEYVKPGKGQAFNRVKMRQVMSGRVVEKTYKSSESIPAADVIDREYAFLYDDGDDYVFMDPASYEQVNVAKTVIADAMQWIKEEALCVVTFWDQQPISVVPPNFVELKVVEAEPSLKGDTVSGGSKGAVLETGAEIRVPMFIEVDDVIKVDTRTQSYMNRVKN